MTNDMNLEQVVPHGKPTMCAHNGKASSVIDLLFASDKTKCSQVKVGDKVPWNTSCHNPITFNLLYKKPSKHHANKKITTYHDNYKRHKRSIIQSTTPYLTLIWRHSIPV